MSRSNFKQPLFKWRNNAKRWTVGSHNLKSLGIHKSKQVGLVIKCKKSFSNLRKAIGSLQRVQLLTTNNEQVSQLKPVQM